MFDYEKIREVITIEEIREPMISAFELLERWHGMLDCELAGWIGVSTAESPDSPLDGWVFPKTYIVRKF